MPATLPALRHALADGALQRDYRALIAFILALRARFERSHPVSALYQGYFDMTYFAVFPPALKARGLKIAIVFNYAAFRFEAWLSGANRQVQRKTWELFKDMDLPGWRIVAPAPGIDSVVECDLASDFDLDDPDLPARLETAALAFIAALQTHLPAG